MICLITRKSKEHSGVCRSLFDMFQNPPVFLFLIFQHNRLRNPFPISIGTIHSIPVFLFLIFNTTGFGIRSRYPSGRSTPSLFFFISHFSTQQASKSVPDIHRDDPLHLWTQNCSMSIEFFYLYNLELKKIKNLVLK